MDVLVFQYLAIHNNENVPNGMVQFAKVLSKY